MQPQDILMPVESAETVPGMKVKELPGLFDKPTLPKPTTARKTDPRTSHKAAERIQKHEQSIKERILTFLSSIEGGACDGCIWKALGKSMKETSITPRFREKPNGLEVTGRTHRKTDRYGDTVACNRPGHEGDSRDARFFGPEIDPAFLEE